MVTQVNQITNSVNLNSDSNISVLSKLNLQHGDSPAHYAIRHRDPKLLERIIDAGFPVFERNDEGLTPFDLAIINGDNEMAALILQKIFGIDPAASKTFLNRRLATSGLASVEKSILEWKAKGSNFNKMTVAAIAAAKGDLDALKAMDTALFRQKDLQGLTPLHYAILNSQAAAVDFLIPHSDPGQLTDDQNNYLHFAAMTGNARIVRSIQAMKIDANAGNCRKLAPVHFFAASCASPSDLLSFAKRGASMLAQDADGLTPAGLLYAKAIQKEPTLLTNPDLALAFSNAIAIGLLYYVSSVGKLSPNDDLNLLYNKMKSLVLAIGAGLVNETAKYYIVSKMPAGKSNPVFRVATKPLMLLFLFPVAMPLAYLSRTYSIVKNSLGGLSSCLSNFRARPFDSIASAAVHLFNGAFEIVPFILQAKAERDSFFEATHPGVKDECSIPDGWASLPEKERFSHPDFKPDKCKNHAEMMLQPTKADADILKSLYSCKDYAKARRNINLAYHPDRGTGNGDIAAKANAAFDLLCPSEPTEFEEDPE